MYTGTAKIIKYNCSDSMITRRLYILHLEGILGNTLAYFFNIREDPLACYPT
jgi:hypothetical protein